MQRDDLQAAIATTGYNVGFGAKKHFASYDIARYGSGLISLCSIAFGIYSLAGHSSKHLSILLIIAGVVAFYIATIAQDKRDKFSSVGSRLTELFRELELLYSQVKTAHEESLTELEEAFSQIKKEFYEISLHDQIFTSDWFAHFKFFYQMDIAWLKEKKAFTWRDKVPASLVLTLLVFALLAAVVRLLEFVMG